MEYCLKVAVRTRFELATSCVTGRHSNQLNYRTKESFFNSIKMVVPTRLELVTSTL